MTNIRLDTNAPDNKLNCIVYSMFTDLCNCHTTKNAALKTIKIY